MSCQISCRRQLRAACQTAFDDARAQLPVDLARQVVAAFYRDVDFHFGFGFGLGFLAAPWIW
ncbi:hypothetical protein PSAB6_270154 [Paraburkholderia sabiae]|nr:hypothetical protein PSAB6_270154 [Paraburkholderia sabiae]